LNNFNNTPDEEFERETTILIVKSCLIKALNTIAIVKQEEEILQYITNLQKEGKKPEPPQDSQREPQPPIVITNRRGVIKQQAFRPGWNLPTMSIEEAGEIDLKEAVEREKMQKELTNANKLVKEYGDDAEVENEIELYKKREFDDWLDDNTKGSGNTGTKGYKY